MKKVFTILIFILFSGNLVANTFTWETMFSKNVGILKDIYFDKNNNFFGYILDSKNGYLITFNYGAVWDSKRITNNREYTKLFVSDIPNKEYVFISATSTQDGKGYLYFSTNHGFNWLQSPIVFDNGLTNVIFFEEEKGVVLDNKNNLYYTNDLSFTFSKIYTFDNRILEFYYKDNVLWAVGENGTVMNSTDRGYTWYSMNLDDYSSENINFIKINDEGKIFICGSNGLFGTSSDRGISWDIEYLGNIDLYSIDFLDNQYGAVVGGNNQQGVMFLTSDAGLNWTEIHPPNCMYFSVKYYSQDKIFCSGLIFESDNIFYGQISIASKNVSVESDNNANLRIFPNPATDVIMIENLSFSNNFEYTKAEIFNMLGVSVWSGYLHNLSSEQLIDVSHLPSGAYFLSIGKKVIRFIKK